ncbi:MAG: DUF2851 family protein [Bacteroidetes bacterium]|nr:DUF2851 family protein [Bacteroidota bacterium]
MISEDLLHHIWKFRLFEQKNITTSKNISLEILKTGEHNKNSGPDFFNARIKINNTEWAGNVEIHVNSSDWLKHKHQNDNAYKNVILHVVYNHDAEIKQNGETLPTLELKNIVFPYILSNYTKLVQSKHTIPCEKQVKGVGEFTISSWLERLAIERLERKSSEITQSLQLTTNNWIAVFYKFLFKSWGFKTNAEPMLQLANSFDWTILEKINGNKLAVESLLFGQAGFLNAEFKDDYPKQLKTEYTHLKHKYSLTTLDASIWKFSKIRPVGFPTIRIAQLASLVSENKNLLSSFLEISNYNGAEKLFQISISDYWKNHFQFDSPSVSKQSVNIGKKAIESIIINTITPIQFTYGKLRDSEKHCTSALMLLEQIDAESNSIIEYWETIGIKAKNAMESQALLELKNNYCNPKKCLQCAIGDSLLKTDL